VSDPALSALSAEELAILFHEVRSPVAALAALSEAAGEADASTLRRLARLARAAIDDLVRLCADEDRVSLGRLEPVSLGELLDRCVNQGASVVGSTQGEIVGDGTRLRQVLANIVANGLRHGNSVTVAAKVVDRVATIVIRDDGPGVPEGLDVFAKGVSGAGSTGYGLWVARQIVEAHGGTLELVRDGEPGACFRIELPLASASA
jgi:two-component system sensor histidine kinase TrcS